jgi:hypothetical protein
MRSQSTRRARICAVSLRGINPLAAWCSNYEFEDVIGTVDDVDLHVLQPGSAFEARQWVARRMVWRRGLRQFTRHVSPGPKTIRIERDYDLFVFICMNPSDLLYLAAVEGWRERCRRAICYMVEVYAGWTTQYAFQLQLLRQFDDVALSFGTSVQAVGQVAGRPCHHVPLGCDVLRFTPFPRSPQRCIDIYSMGRRSEVAHEELLARAARGEVFYLYDTIPGLLVQPKNYRQHRDLLGNCARRSRCFVAYPAKIDEAGERQGQSEVGARFFEGAAAGAVLVGMAPTAPAFARDFHWPDAVVELGSTRDSVQSAFATLFADPRRLSEAGSRNAIEALRAFDWSYRWAELIKVARLEPDARLAARHRALRELADVAAEARAA